MLASNQDSKFLKMSLSSLIRSLSLDIKTTWRNKLFAKWASSHYLTSPLAMDTEKAWPWTYITRSRKLKLITSNSSNKKHSSVKYLNGSLMTMNKMAAGMMNVMQLHLGAAPQLGTEPQIKPTAMLNSMSCG